MNPKEIIKRLRLKPHQVEGGYFRETYRSEEKIAVKSLPARYKGKRTFSTLIYYLLTKTAFSAMHRVKSDEVFHFYAGDPVEMLQLLPGGKGKIITLGNNITKGHLPQVVVRRGVWQGSRLKQGGKFALFGNTVAPGFEFADYEHGDRQRLIKQYPKFKNKIMGLTKRKVK